MSLAPVAFISHGAPTLALEPGKLGAQLRTLGAQLDNVTAILVASPHWQTEDFVVTTHLSPPTIHDFGGFPAALYELNYPAKGHPALALAAKDLLAAADFSVEIDPERGLDHGAWVPLWHLRPRADKPVFQVSLPWRLDPATAVQMGHALEPLREQGVMILGSGSLTHNLGDIRPPGSAIAAYVDAFAGWVRQTVLARDVEKLLAYRTLAPYARRAHPTDEHFLPLLVAMAASRHDDAVAVLGDEVRYGTLSMESYLWAAPNVQAAASSCS